MENATIKVTGELVAQPLPDKRYRIAFLSQEDPTDQRTWSGITYHLYKQMGRFYDVHWVHANDVALTRRRILSLWNRMADLLRWKFTTHYFLNAFFLSQRAEQKIKKENFDLVVVGAGESELIAYLKTQIPIVYIADTTFRNMVNYYPWHTGLCKLALRQGNRIEKNAIQKAAHLIYSSQWASNSAIRDYGAKADRVSILSFGANMSRLPAKEEVEARPFANRCHLLFLGVHWERKGGPIVYQTFLELREKGIDCRLTIIGCAPFLPKDEDITVIPFLNKNDKQQSERLFQILMETSFLFVPTRADCTPVVFSEAAAFGVPVITTQTGGVGSVIREGKNGYCLPLEATAVDYSALIEKVWCDKDRYNQLRLSSRTEYDQRLNWHTWIMKFNVIVESLALVTKTKSLSK
ncbi:glycosyltransferase family 4 protein [Flavisolibacter ginsenosidimutans]|uniref:Glycosyltransferase family 4 protein n=1 Tax=Flavisolibacter ginsenosidimutans TaxID=661481 RepID=A0A5B8UEC4_9BACT|nr:glycosyltransferase family 4 protein [Flavisolibacter ginsenosidimutans]QEC54858.1 glycosyltransferase family 4 protein [Flavisolibacter ginsenosidimutans]